MAVTSFEEIHNGRDGDDEISRRGGVRRYTRVFRATTNNNDDDASVVLTSAPMPGSRYPTDFSAYLRRRKANNQSFSKRVWIVTCAYSTQVELEEDPLNDPAEITWSTEQFQRPLVKDRDGKAVLNSAGDYFDPVAMRDDSRITATIRKNLAVVPSWILSYADAINADAFVLDGIEIATNVAKIQAVGVGPWEARNDIAYRVVSITMHFKSDTWVESIHDAGFRKRNNMGELVDIFNSGDDGKPTTPVSLNGLGQAQDDPTPDNAKYRDFDVYDEQDFTVLPLT